MLFLLIKSIHLLSVLILFGCLLVEHFLVTSLAQTQNTRRLVLVDALYGLSSVLILASGFYIALFSGKGTDFYFDNPVIYLKLAIFIAVGLLSIFPTIQFLKANKQQDFLLFGRHKLILLIIKVEIGLILLIPFLGVCLSNGYHLF